MTTTNLKELLYLRGLRGGNRVAAVCDNAIAMSKRVKVKAKATGEDIARNELPKRSSLPSNIVTVKSVRQLTWRGLINGVHFLFFVWGLVVLYFHIQASVQISLPQCMLQVRPWAVSRPSCFLLCLDCYRLGISGHLGEVDLNWREFDGSTVVMMLIRHCPALEVPDLFNDFHNLLSIKIYNSTIVEWRDSVAITKKNHPGLLSLMLVRVNMTDGVLPSGFLSSDTPLQLYDIEMCVTNLCELPDDLDVKWLLGSCVVVEHSQLRSVPASLLRLMPSYLSLMGNPISSLPPEIFEIEGMADLGIGDTNIRELPQNVTQLSSTLTTIYMSDTDVSYFWHG
ncbi:Leucine-rich repeat domain, L domain-like [Phytophthora cactorum]|nr:Leucine-rich repeat domain, L domain-like [Phytophthora cactorum]